MKESAIITAIIFPVNAFQGYGVFASLSLSPALLCIPAFPASFLSYGVSEPSEPELGLVGCGVLQDECWPQLGVIFSGSVSMVIGLTQPLSLAIPNSWEKWADWLSFSQMFTLLSNQLCWGGASFMAHGVGCLLAHPPQPLRRHW